MLHIIGRLNLFNLFNLPIITIRQTGGLIEKYRFSILQMEKGTERRNGTTWIEVQR